MIKKARLLKTMDRPVNDAHHISFEVRVSVDIHKGTDMVQVVVRR